MATESAKDSFHGAKSTPHRTTARGKLSSGDARLLESLKKLSTITNTYSRDVPMRNQCCNNRKHAHGKGTTVHVDNSITLL